MSSRALQYPAAPFVPSHQTNGAPGPSEWEKHPVPNGPNGDWRPIPPPANGPYYPPPVPPMHNKTFPEYGPQAPNAGGHGGYMHPPMNYPNGYHAGSYPHPYPQQNGPAYPPQPNDYPYPPPPQPGPPHYQQTMWQPPYYNAPPPPYQPVNYNYYPNGQQQYMPNTQYNPGHVPPPPHPDPPFCQLEDPEAKLFVGDLPVKMTVEQLSHALAETFGFFGECVANVTWKPSRGSGGVEKSLPAGWVQFENLFDARRALDASKEVPVYIGDRPVRVDRADGRRICRLWPADPHARPTANDFKRVVRLYIKKCDKEFGKHDYNQMYHVSDDVEMVEKPYGARIYRVPSVGVVFRWVEDADNSQAQMAQLMPDFNIKIERVKCGIPSWTSGPASLQTLDAIDLDAGQRWQAELTRSRRLLEEGLSQKEREVEEKEKRRFPPSERKCARYPGRISKSSLMRSILESSRLRKEVFGEERLEGLDLCRARAGGGKSGGKSGRVDGHK